MKTILKLIDFNGELTNDPKCDVSKALLEHLNPPGEYSTALLDVKSDLRWISGLAKAHGWKVVLRVPSKKEIESLMDDGGG